MKKDVNDMNIDARISSGTEKGPRAGGKWKIDFPGSFSENRAPLGD